MRPIAYTQAAYTTAALSFLAGTGLFTYYYATSAMPMLFYGLAFLVVAVILNALLFIAILAKSRRAPACRKALRTAAFTMLLNLAPAVGYSVVSLKLLNTMRITFVNETNAPIEDVSVSGCESKSIGNLEVGEEVEVWIGIHGDCSIWVQYEGLGTVKRESVVGYATGGMGQRHRHAIDGRDKDLL